jgi:hypothetical protein
MVFPLPGGHCMRRLCPPAAAMRRARFACSWPMISWKSTAVLDNIGSITVRFTHSGIGWSPVSISTASDKVATHITSISGMTLASRVLSIGRNILFIPSSRARMAAGRAHWIGRMIPSSATSPRKSEVRITSSSKSISFPSIPSAIGRS